MTRLIRPLTMMATKSDTEVATPMFCSTTSTERPSSCARRSRRCSDLPYDQRRQPLGRFIHHEEPADCCEQGARYREHLLFAARKLSAAVIAALRQSRECRIDPVDRPEMPGRAHALAEAQGLVDGKTRPEAASLRHEADASSDDLMRFRGEISRPSSRTAPDRAHIRPTIVLQSVVLPMPLRPTTDRTPRSRTSARRLAGHAIRHSRPADPALAGSASKSKRREPDCQAMLRPEVDGLYLSVRASSPRFRLKRKLSWRGGRCRRGHSVYSIRF